MISGPLTGKLVLPLGTIYICQILVGPALPEVHISLVTAWRPEIWKKSSPSQIGNSRNLFIIIPNFSPFWEGQNTPRHGPRAFLSNSRRTSSNRIAFQLSNWMAFSDMEKMVIGKTSPIQYRKWYPGLAAFYFNIIKQKNFNAIAQTLCRNSFWSTVSPLIISAPQKFVIPKENRYKIAFSFGITHFWGADIIRGDTVYRKSQ